MPNEKEAQTPKLTLAQVRESFAKLRDAVDLDRAPSDELRGIFGYMQANANLGVLLCSSLENWIVQASQDIGGKLHEIEQRLQSAAAPAEAATEGSAAPPSASAQAAAEIANLPPTMRGQVTQVPPVGAQSVPNDPAAIAAAMNKANDVPLAPVLSVQKG